MLFKIVFFHSIPVCEFRCSDGTCIRQSEVCDTILDCRDGSDARNCGTPFANVYYLTHQDVPLACPDMLDTLGTCTDDCDRTNCNDGNICCESSCGQTCTAGTPRTPLCPSVQSQNERTGLLGRFIPRCNQDGSFLEVQCHEHYCWCVNVLTGDPVSDGIEGEEPQCGGFRCEGTDGVMLGIGESQMSGDGCNMW